MRPQRSNKASVIQDHLVYDQYHGSSAKGKENSNKKFRKFPNQKAFSQARSDNGSYRTLLEKPSSTENLDMGKYVVKE